MGIFSSQTCSLEGGCPNTLVHIVLVMNILYFSELLHYKYRWQSMILKELYKLCLIDIKSKMFFKEACERLWYN